MPDDHSELVPLLPIPNRTVKRLSADDSADSRVKVGHRQALITQKAQQKCWALFKAELALRGPASATETRSLDVALDPMYTPRLC